jgi:hypothetical protein
MLEGHPVMHRGACMVKLIKLPPSKHVLMLSTPLILKNKNKLRACNEFKKKFRGVFKALKTNALTGIVCFHLLRASFSQLDHGGIGFGSNFG